MKIKFSKILFSIFSYLSDQTGGKPFVVKYKLLIGTFLLGSAQVSAQDTTVLPVTKHIKPIVRDYPTCYIAVSDELYCNLKITDVNNEPISDVDISLKNKTNIAPIKSDQNGEFTIRVTRRDILVFVLSGYKTREIGVREMLQDKSIIVMEKYSDKK